MDQGFHIRPDCGGEHFPLVQSEQREPEPVGPVAGVAQASRRERRGGPPVHQESFRPLEMVEELPEQMRHGVGMPVVQESEGTVLAERSLPTQT